MITPWLAALALAAALSGAGCRRSNEQVRSERGERPDASSDGVGSLARPGPSAAPLASAGALAPPGPSAAPLASAPPEEASNLLTALPPRGAMVWFGPPQREPMQVFSVSGAVIASIGQGLYRVDGGRLFKVPVRLVPDQEHPELRFEVMQVSGRYPGQLWLGRASVVARTPFVEFYRQQPGGDFVQVPIGWMALSRPSIAWDGERLLLPASDDQPMRWVDPAGQETLATLAGLPAGCARSPYGLAPPTSRGWVLERMECQPGGTQLWLFDREGRGRPIEGVSGIPRALLVRPDGDTWFAVKGSRPSLCHLAGGKARCEPIPTSSG
ncbi:MAG: hypothetical protein EOO75_07870, partial [Myxococcales bacterium]